MDYAAGLDLSLTGSGLAVLGDQGWRTRLIKSTGHLDDSLQQRRARVHKMHQAIMDFVPEDVPVAVEQPAYSASGGSHHDRSGLWWLVVDELIGYGYRVVELAPQKPKKFTTGSGTASKMEVVAAAIKRYPTADIIDDNVADAVGLAAMLAANRGYFNVSDWPQKNLDAMKGIAW